MYISPVNSGHHGRLKEPWMAVSSGADPGFLERGFRLVKVGGGLALLLLS